MRRKNWIDKKKFFYDNFIEHVSQNKNKFNGKYIYNFFLKICSTPDKFNNKDQLQKIFFKRLKKSNLNTNLNYHFYLYFLKFLKVSSKKSLHKSFFKNSRILFLFSPIYMFKSQFFENRSLFNDLLLNFKLKGFFIYKNFFKNSYVFDNVAFKKHLYGYNFYIFNKNFKQYENILKLTDNKEYNSIGKIKLLLKDVDFYNFFLKNELNYFLIYNVFLLNTVEVYKIILLLYVNKLVLFNN